MWAVVMLFVGPQWIRNDLRSDFAHFDLLRSYPIPGRSVIAAEAAGSAAVLTLMQLALLLLAYLAFLGNETMELTLTERTLGLVAAVVYLPAISFLSMLIQNAGAILFPTWIRPGPERAGGVEALGQNMLLIIAHVGIITVLMAVPFVAAAAVQVVLHPALAGWAEIPRAAVFLALIAFEAQCDRGLARRRAGKDGSGFDRGVSPGRGTTPTTRRLRAPLEAAETERYRGKDKKAERGRGNQSAENDDGHRAFDFAARIAAPDRERQESERGDERRHEDRPQAFERTADGGGPSPGFPLHVHQVIVVRDQHHRVTRGDTEQRDKSDE